MVALETVQLRISCTPRVEAVVGVVVPRSIACRHAAEVLVLALGIAFAGSEPDGSGALE